MFDVGIANYLARKKVVDPKGDIVGDAFEHDCLLEIIAYIGLKELDYPMTYWRTKTGLEVDFVINHGDIAIEVKLSENPARREVKGLSAFCADYNPRAAYVICQTPHEQIMKTEAGYPINVIHWQSFGRGR